MYSIYKRTPIYSVVVEGTSINTSERAKNRKMTDALPPPPPPVIPPLPPKEYMLNQRTVGDESIILHNYTESFELETATNTHHER